MRNLMKPGVMLSNIWPQSRQTEGETLKGLEEAIKLDFFEAIQIVDIPHAEERKRFAETLAAHNLPGNMAMTRILNLNNLNLSSLDEDLRERSVKGIVNELDNVRETGVRRCTLVSGPRPEKEEDRGEALKRFQESLSAICAAGAENPALEIQIEPLDYFAHKNMTLGTAAEGAAIVGELSQTHSNLTLCIDTAHMRLNEEDFIEGIRAGFDHINEFHFCNPCVDRNHEVYGDNHLLFGEPGALTEEDVAKTLVEAARVGFLSETRRPTVAFEILSSDRMSGVDLLRHCKELFERCWEKAKERMEAE